ncbi:hypothetical protein DFH07DRAFT_768276 [Mycena maculata]|uniref:Uncharacterized protein n=1 Tax=Mycena maculata TaxID=230809 RepID=A0AAD7JT15_9AGAR|nr:hypothetical protein DFH07DRAFT_768276 [Mycena maculata]
MPDLHTSTFDTTFVQMHATCDSAQCDGDSGPHSDSPHRISPTSLAPDELRRQIPDSSPPNGHPLNTSTVHRAPPPTPSETDTRSSRDSLPDDEFVQRLRIRLLSFGNDKGGIMQQTEKSCSTLTESIRKPPPNLRPRPIELVVRRFSDAQGRDRSVNNRVREAGFSRYSPGRRAVYTGGKGGGTCHKGTRVAFAAAFQWHLLGTCHGLM